MLSIRGLRKTFGDITAVDRVTFQVNPREIYGLLGPNGAGKSTTMNMICGLLKPDDGRIQIDGKDLATDSKAVKQMMGVVPQNIALYEELTAIENLRFWGGLRGMKGNELTRRCRELLNRIGLIDRAREPVQRYSGGMKRRLNLAAALIHEPKLLLLDEPTVGIDPQARQNILEIIKETIQAGTTVLYTTHYLEEAEMLCDRIGVMDRGMLLAEGTLKELTEIVGESQIVKVQGKFSRDDMTAAVQTLKEVEISWIENGKAVLMLPSEHVLPDLLKQIFRQDWIVEDVSVKPPSLESVFLKLTGRELRD
jgi:linearmycin/streptolysin S transport system ATP-binding protein